MKWSNRSLFMLFLAAVIFSSCTKKRDSSEITVSMPPMKIQKAGEVSAMTVELELGHLVINVTGSNMSPIELSWDSHHPNPLCTFDAMGNGSCTLDIPKGESRFFQVLAIYQPVGSDGGSNMNFYYDDVTQSISGDTTVPMVLEPITNGTVAATGSAGRITGRYADPTTGSFYTGPVLFKYKPQNAPAMTVHKGEMFNGWFEVFALQGDVKFSYVRGDGHIMFGGPVGPDTLSLYRPNPSPTPAAPYPKESTVRFLYPASFRPKWEDGQLIGRRPEEAQRIAVGFFGPGGETKKVCFKQTDTLSDFYVDDTNSATIGWSTSLGPNASYAGPEAITFANGTTSKGGHSYSTGFECAGASTEFVDYFHWYPQDPWSGAGFKGPFKLQAIAGQNYRNEVLVDFVPFGNQMNLTWAYLPGVGGSTIASTDIFIRASATNDQNEDYRDPDSEGYLCSKLVEKGFRKIKNVAASNGANTTSFQVTTTEGQAWSQGRLKMILCPLSSSGKYFLSAGEARSGGGGQNQFSLVWQSGPSLTQPADGAGCTARNIEFQKNGTAFMLPTGSSLNINLSGMSNGNGGGGNPTFFASSADCSSNISSINTTLMTAGSSSKTVYVRSSEGVGDIQASVTGLGSNIWVNEARATIAFVSAGAPDRVKISMSDKLATGLCYPLYLSLQNASNQVKAAGSVGSVTINAPVAGSFYSDMMCTASTSSSVGFATADAAQILFFKPISTGSGQFTTTNDLSLTDENFGTVMVGDQNIAEYDVRSYSMNGNGKTFDNANTCTPINIAALNSAYAEIPVSVNTPLTVTVSGNATLHSNATCSDTGTASKSVTLSTYGGIGNLYLKNLSLLDVDVLVDDGTNNSTSTFKLKLPDFLQVNAPTALHKGFCHKGNVELRANGSPYAAKGSLLVNAAISGATGLIYSDNACTNSIAQIAFTAGQTNKDFYYMVTAGTSWGLWLELADDNMIDAFYGPSNPTTSIVDIASFDFFRASSAGCSVYDIRPFNGSPMMIQEPLAVRVEISSSNRYVRLFSDAGCSAPLGSDTGTAWRADITIPSNSTFVRMYINNLSTPVSFTTSATTLSTTTSTGIFVSPVNTVSGTTTGTHSP